MPNGIRWSTSAVSGNVAVRAVQLSRHPSGRAAAPALRQGAQPLQRMIPNIAPEVVSTVVFAVVYRPDGASLNDIAGAFTAPSDVQQVEGWVAALVAAGVLDSVTDGATTRYFATPAASAYLTPSAPSASASAAAVPGVPSPSSAPSSLPSTPPSAPPSGAPSGPSSAPSTPPSRGPESAAGTAALPGNPPSSIAPSGGAPAASGPAVVPGNPASPSAPSAAPSPPPSAARFEAVFGRVVLDIVCRLMTRIAAANYLAVRAGQELEAAEIPAFVQYGRDRLTRLALGECTRLGLDPAQYEVWRQQYFGVAAAPSAAPSSPLPSTLPNAGANVPPSAPSTPPPRSHRPRTDDVPDLASSSTAGAPAVAVRPAGQDAADAAADDLVAGLLKPFLDVLLRPSAPSPAGAVPSAPGGVSAPESVSGAVLGRIKTLVRDAAAAVLGRDRRRLVVVVRALLLLAVIIAGYAAALRVYVFVRQAPWLAAGVALALAVLLVLVDRFLQGRKAAKATVGSAVSPAVVATVAPAVQGAAEPVPTTFPPAVSGAVPGTFQGTLKGSAPRRIWLLTWGLVGISAVAVVAVVVATRLYMDSRMPTTTPSTAGATAAQKTEPMAAAAAGQSAAAAATSVRGGGPEQGPGSALPGRGEGQGAGRSAGQGAATATATSGDAATDRGQGREGASNLTPKPSNAATAAAPAATAAALRSGTLLVGVVVDAAAGDSQRVAVEITAAPAGTQRVSAVLRSDGAWSEARSFQGEWTADEEGGVLTLRTRKEDRVDGAGPLLSDPADRTVVLRLREDGSVTSTPAGWQLRTVDAADAATVRAEFTRALVPLLAATQPGRVYRGTATSLLRKTAEPLVLRFTEQEADGALLRATLESATNPAWVRAFRGTLVGNTYRAAGSPLRLRSDDGDRVSAADPRTVLGLNTYNNSLVLPLHLDGVRLVGQDQRFVYEFAPADAGASDRILRSESESDRVTRSESESESGRVTRSESESESERGGGRGSGSALGSGLSALGSSQSSNLTPNSSNGAAAVAAATGAGAPAAALPTFPAAGGAYALVDGRWVRLPKNNGRVMQSPAQVLAAQLWSAKRYQDALAKLPPETATEAVGELDFDGISDVPTVRSEGVVIACVGVALPTPTPVKDYPELKTYPAVELAPLTARANGSRAASLYPVVRGIVGFGKDRVEATVEVKAVDAGSVAILRCKGPLPAGRYALWGGPEPCEMAVAAAVVAVP